MFLTSSSLQIVHLDLYLNALLCAMFSFRFVIVRSQIESAVVVNDSQPDAVQPAASAQHILDDRRIGEEIDERMCANLQHIDLHLVPECFEAAVGGSKALENSASQI